MTYEDFEKKQKKIEIINNLLDKLNYMLNKVNEEEKQQILFYMECLEMEYRNIENGLVKIRRNK